MRIEAHAKVNLGLDVKYRRDDGYHEVDMIFYEISVADIIDIEKRDEPGIVLTCSDPSLENENNLAYRAAALMFDCFGERNGAAIHIEKHIPMQAGLGGGSSDAASVLKGMNELFGFGASPEKLRELGLKLGADVPFFIEGGCARAGGIGEKLRQIKGVPKLNILIIKPEESISTAYAYGNLKPGENAYHPDIDALENALVSGDIRKAASLMGNSLESAVADRYPIVEELKNELMERGALGSLMTGSGSAVFGIFGQDIEHVREYPDKGMYEFIG